MHDEVGKSEVQLIVFLWNTTLCAYISSTSILDITGLLIARLQCFSHGDFKMMWWQMYSLPLNILLVSRRADKISTANTAHYSGNAPHSHIGSIPALLMQSCTHDPSSGEIELAAQDIHTLVLFTYLQLDIPGIL